MNCYLEGLSGSWLSLSQPIWQLLSLFLALDPFLAAEFFNLMSFIQFKQLPVVAGDTLSYVGWSQLSALDLCFGGSVRVV